MIAGIVIYLVIGVGIATTDRMVVDGFADKPRPMVESAKLAVGYPIYFMDKLIRR